MTFVLKYVAALKGLHRADIVLECNSLKNFFPSWDKQVSQLGQFWENFENAREINP